MDWVNWDIVIVLGMALVALSFPAILTAFSSSTPSPIGYVMLGLGVVMITSAALMTPGGYPPNELPNVVVKVIGGFFH